MLRLYLHPIIGVLCFPLIHSEPLGGIPLTYLVYMKGITSRRTQNHFKGNVAAD